MSIRDELAQLSLDLTSVLDDCKPDDMVKLSNQLKSAANTTKTDLATLNATLQTSPIENHADVIKVAEHALGDLRELISMTKGIASHLYGQLVTIDLNDPELISAAAEFIRSTRESIADFIQLYRDEQNFLYKTQLSMLQFAQKKELLKYKAELEANKNTINADVVETVQYSQEEVMDILNS